VTNVGFLINLFNEQSAEISKSSNLIEDILNTKVTATMAQKHIKRRSQISIGEIILSLNRKMRELNGENIEFP
jgi:hypothetical protein